MKPILITVLILFLGFSAWSQSIERAVVGSAGKVEAAPDLRLEWTLGEVAVHHYAPGRLNEGFHQPALQVQPYIAIAPEAGLFEVFPNPAGAVLHVRGELPEEKQAFIRLLDGAGKTAGSPLPARGSFDQEFDLSAYPPGMYNLVITDAGGKVIRTERIIKQ
ncbi:MAG TPA: T9SS type A sorting domain-containing protein [Flavilitoribacter sp.]|nr:T9SS type A sorting domain-containing protein [Flavilitoribacter sp.]HMQ88539.1 T9SS type A sorting domain-containing protein [Flavilitoribacter sp.]